MSLDLDGRDRLYIQYRPDKMTLQSLIGLQEKFDASKSIVASSSLHLTVLHIGIIDNVYAQLKSVNTELDQALFLDETQKLYERCMAITPDVFELQPISIDYYGAGTTTIGLSYMQNDIFDHAVSGVLLKVKKYLSALSIDHMALPYYRGGLQLYDLAKPHVSLIKNNDEIIDLKHMQYEFSQNHVFVVDKA